MALALCTVGVPMASAQTDAPPGVANSRAARDADNPMRMIIEASKLKVRIKADGPEPAAADKRAAPSPKPVAAPVAKRAASAPVTAAAASQSVPSAVAAAPVATPATAAAPAPGPAAHVATPAAPSQTLAKLAEPVSPAAALSQPAVQALPPQPLKRLQMVEPSLPSNVLRRIRSDLEVVVGFTVNADGSVADVVIRSNPMKTLDASIVEAVSQWRYQPIREARTHAVQLVLRANP